MEVQSSRVFFKNLIFLVVVIKRVASIYAILLQLEAEVSDLLFSQGEIFLSPRGMSFLLPFSK